MLLKTIFIFKNKYNKEIKYYKYIITILKNKSKFKKILIVKLILFLQYEFLLS